MITETENVYEKPILREIYEAEKKSFEEKLNNLQQEKAGANDGEWTQLFNAVLALNLIQAELGRIYEKFLQGYLNNDEHTLITMRPVIYPINFKMLSF